MQHINATVTDLSKRFPWMDMDSFRRTREELLAGREVPEDEGDADDDEADDVDPEEKDPRCTQDDFLWENL
jgi:hypothetical protein